MSGPEVLAWLLLIAIALSAAVVCLIPICAGILNNRAAASAVAKLRAGGVFLDAQVDAEWNARCAEYERLFPDLFRDLTPAQEAAVGRVEIALASTEEATDDELWRLIEEAR